MPTNSVRVFLVDDTMGKLMLMRRRLSVYPDVEVIGSAINGLDALELIPGRNPDVVCITLGLPRVDSVQLTRALMQRHPLPILVIGDTSDLVTKAELDQIQTEGAVEIFPSRGLATGDQVAWDQLVRALKIASRVRVVRRFARSSTARTPISLAAPASPAGTTTLHSILAFGSSTGGPHSLQAVLTRLPREYQAPVICVQHIAKGFLAGLVDWLRPQCALKVEVATAGGRPQPGTIYFAPEDSHLTLDSTGAFALSQGEPVDGHRPSITLTFESLARFYGPRCTGVLLTGMGKDGAQGLLAIAQAGGATITQDERSSTVYGMPKAAVELNAAQHVLSLEEIAGHLLKLAREGGSIGERYREAPGTNRRHSRRRR